MWRDLVQVYALRAREFSDAVATLGQHSPMGIEALQQITKIKKRRAACKVAGEALEQFIELQRTRLILFSEVGPTDAVNSQDPAHAAAVPSAHTSALR